MLHADFGCQTCADLSSPGSNCCPVQHSCSPAGPPSACHCCFHTTFKCCLLLIRAFPCWTLQNQVQQVLNVAYAMVGLANGGLGLLEDLQNIVDVDVNFPLFLSYFGVGVVSNILMPAHLKYSFVCQPPWTIFVLS